MNQQRHFAYPAQGLSLVTLNTALEFDATAASAAFIDVRGIWTGTLFFEVTVDGTNWIGINGVDITSVGLGSASLSGNGFRTVQLGGFVKFRIRVSVAGSGTATVRVVLGDDIVMPYIAGVSPGAGSNYLGKAEDAVFSDGDVGVYVLGVRRDSLATAETSAAGDYCSYVVDGNGRSVIAPYAPPGASWQFASGADVTGTGSNTAKAAVASIRNYVTSITLTNTSAIATRVEILSASTVIHHLYLPANGGVAVTFPVPLRGGVNEAINFQCVTTATATRASMIGFEGVM